MLQLLRSFLNYHKINKNAQGFETLPGKALAIQNLPYSRHEHCLSYTACPDGLYSVRLALGQRGFHTSTVHPETVADSTSEGRSPARLTSPPLPQTPIASPGTLPALLTNGLHTWEVPKTPSLGSINLQGQLAELRETFYFLDYYSLL